MIRPFLAAGHGDDGGDLPPAYELEGLRPFLLTGGRTVADGSIALETQVVATERGSSQTWWLPPEQRQIVELCLDPLSVVEIAARTALQLGVVRVLVGDLSGAGMLSVYLPNGAAAADADTLRRVIRGLRAIR
jgi:hypothetical protein